MSELFSFFGVVFICADMDFWTNKHRIVAGEVLVK